MIPQQEALCKIKKSRSFITACLGIDLHKKSYTTLKSIKKPGHFNPGFMDLFK
jgi:hypothetical protein